MFGKILGEVVGTAVRVVNLPAEAADRLVLNAPKDDPTLAVPGREVAKSLEDLLKSLDGEE